MTPQEAAAAGLLSTFRSKPFAEMVDVHSLPKALEQCLSGPPYSHHDVKELCGLLAQLRISSTTIRLMLADLRSKSRFSATTLAQMDADTMPKPAQFVPAPTASGPGRAALADIPWWGWLIGGGILVAVLRR